MSLATNDENTARETPRSRSTMGTGTLVTLVVFALLVIGGYYAILSQLKSQRDSGRDTFARNELKNLVLIALEYAERHNGNLPPDFEVLQQSSPRFKVSVRNPVTESMPAYEYVFLGNMYKIDDESLTPMIYQLCDGQRALDLPIAYADGSVRGTKSDDAEETE